jgi:hypothetical protein
LNQEIEKKVLKENNKFFTKDFFKNKDPEIFYDQMK